MTDLATICATKRQYRNTISFVKERIGNTTEITQAIQVTD